MNERFQMLNHLTQHILNQLDISMPCKVVEVTDEGLTLQPLFKNAKGEDYPLILLAPSLKQRQTPGAEPKSPVYEVNDTVLVLCTQQALENAEGYNFKRRFSFQDAVVLGII